VFTRAYFVGYFMVLLINFILIYIVFTVALLYCPTRFMGSFWIGNILIVFVNANFYFDSKHLHHFICSVVFNLMIFLFNLNRLELLLVSVWLLQLMLLFLLATQGSTPPRLLSSRFVILFLLNHWIMNILAITVILMFMSVFQTLGA
jgi:hypothetical protein